MAVRALVLALLVALAAAAPAAAATTAAADPNALTRPDRLDRPPVGHRLTGEQARAIAARTEAFRDERAAHPRADVQVFLKGPTRWQLSLHDRPGGREVAQVIVDDATGAVLEAWTGPQVAWTMARGYPGAFGRKVTALYVWLPLLVLFVLPFVDPRRPFRMRHLDLLALCALSASLAAFNHGDLDRSVPLQYPPLLYLLVRLTWIGLRRNRPGDPLRLLVPASWLAVGLVFLLGFRVGLNVTDSNVIDVGLSGVIGADKLTHGTALYGGWPAIDPSGDTYGPVAYLAYVPFELLLPWSGAWDELPAAHGAAIVFDLLCVAGLWLLGRRLGGRTLGIALAYAWVSCPWTLFALNTNTNDTLVAALLVALLLVAARPAARGAVAALAGLTKLGPLALAPLMLTHGRGGRLRFLAAFAATALVAGLPVLLQGDPGLVWDRTIGFQAGRDAPFSVWGLYDLPDAALVAVQALAVLFALVVAVVPRRDDVVGLAALAGAVLVAVQLGATYWFHLYVVWVLPLALVAFLAAPARRVSPPAPAPAPARSRPPAALASSG